MSASTRDRFPITKGQLFSLSINHELIYTDKEVEQTPQSCFDLIMALLEEENDAIVTHYKVIKVKDEKHISKYDDSGVLALEDKIIKLKCVRDLLCLIAPTGFTNARLEQLLSEGKLQIITEDYSRLLLAKKSKIQAEKKRQLAQQAAKVPSEYKFKVIDLGIADIYTKQNLFSESDMLSLAKELIKEDPKNKIEVTGVADRRLLKFSDDTKLRVLQADLLLLKCARLLLLHLKTASSSYDEIATTLHDSSGLVERIKILENEIVDYKKKELPKKLMDGIKEKEKYLELRHQIRHARVEHAHVRPSLFVQHRNSVPEKRVSPVLLEPLSMRPSLA